MTDDLSPKKPRRPHPLEVGPQPPDVEQQNSQRVMLRLPVVKPYAVWALIAINSLIYIVVRFVISEAQAFELYSAAWSNQTRVLVDGEYLRLLSAMFLHSYDFLLHILFNMYALYVIGITVERFYGHTRFLIIYFLGGLTGSLLSVLLNPANVVSVGASGAVFAIFGAEIVFFYKHRKLFGQLARVQLQQALLIAGVNFAIGFFNSLGDTAVNIDNWGHVGGFAGGMIVAWLISPMLMPKQHPTQTDALTIEDINPLERRTQPLMIYTSALLGVLLFASLLAR